MGYVRRSTCYLGHKFVVDASGRQRCPICQSVHSHKWRASRKDQLTENPFLPGDKVELTRAVKCGTGKIIPVGETGVVLRRQNENGIAMVLFESYDTYLSASLSCVRHIPKQE